MHNTNKIEYSKTQAIEREYLAATILARDMNMIYREKWQIEVTAIFNN